MWNLATNDIFTLIYWPNVIIYCWNLVSTDIVEIREFEKTFLKFVILTWNVFSSVISEVELKTYIDISIEVLYFAQHFGLQMSTFGAHFDKNYLFRNIVVKHDGLELRNYQYF